MLTELEVETDLDVPDSDSEYPPELVERWIRGSDILALKLETGEIKPKSLREAAAERGIEITV
ncbi:hypothetical protein R80B4_00989 [Fibrobacteres bacterium R8-0-B4]